MRGDGRVRDGMFSYVSLEQRAPSNHPLREVKKITHAVLRTLSPEFDALYAYSGSAPEYILRELLFVGVLLRPFRAPAGRADRLHLLFFR
jgi:hypothetical protein